MYTLLVVDYSECYCANVYSDGEISKLFSATSLVPNKMRVGGQSAARFQRCRQNEIKQWFKKIDQMLFPVQGDVIIGISNVYYSFFRKHLRSQNIEKIKKQVSTGYSGLTGIYDMINTLQPKKSKAF